MWFGTVTAFDEQVGLGIVESDGGEAFQFHAIEIVGGARTLEAGSRVVFRMLPRFGRMQAGHLRPV